MDSRYRYQKRSFPPAPFAGIGQTSGRRILPLLAILAALALIAGAGIVAIQPDEVPAGPPVQNGNITVDALTVVVAAHDSSAAAKAQADYVCTGTNDHLVIQRAISAAPAGGTVLLLEGTYHCAGTITPRAHSTLKGQGESATVLDFRSGYIRLASQYTILSDLTVTGSGYISITQSHMRLRNVTVTEVDNTFMGAFVIYASGRVIEDVEFTGCRAIDVNRWGFVHTGEGSPNRVKNIRYIDCQAINCGRSGQYRGGWDVGFNIAEVTDAEDIL
ncbi:MAG: glycoside hydrolase family 55 protein, partial [Methanomicrobiaceae archaeon]|nr:glycoside hydrolase family 55 protein [Methanomicrobiaceae archaeon]